MTIVIQQEHQTAQIPDWVRDINSFRKWAKSDEFATRGWYAHLGGKLWVDASMEKLVHNQIKIEFTVILGGLVREARSGRFIGDQMLLTNLDADLSTVPDGMFVSHETVRDGRVLLKKGTDSLEVIGSPEMILEVVSPTSVQKDTVILRDLYYRAGVSEYWLVDPRRDDFAFDILRRGTRGFISTRKHADWIKSAIFDRSFRLVREDDPNGQPLYRLDVR
jgi:Uma2 family endonuclease